jgi:CRP-like cAMP-binding protein
MMSNSPYSRSHEDFFLKHGDPVRYERGEHLVWHKDESIWVFFLLEGIVRISFSFSTGTRGTVGYFVPGSTFAQTGSFVADSDIHLEYIAETKIFAYRIPRDIFLLQIDRDASFAQDLLNFTLRNQRILLERIMYQGEKGVYRKCIRWLLFMAKYYSKKESTGHKILVPITQDTAADFLYVTRESAGKVLANLEKKGLITFSKKYLSIPSSEKLSSLLTAKAEK